MRSKTRSRSSLVKTAPNDPAHTARAADLNRVTDGQTERQTPRTSVTIVCISCIRCSPKRDLFAVTMIGYDMESMASISKSSAVYSEQEKH